MNYLGIDTSAYTTSLAVIDSRNELIWEKRRVLAVPEGEKGLAQSAAFFQHVQNLPELLQAVPNGIWENRKAVGVSARPRPLEGSYMPVFTAGYAIAAGVACSRQIKLIETTHQEGHLMAGLVSASGFQANTFLAVHLSGGTTELLLVRRQTARLDIELLGGTTDLHAGQFVDRIGVRLGLSFPAGKELEFLAQKAKPEASSILPSAARGFEVSFSGVETAAQRLIEAGKPAADVARAVEGCIARTVFKLITSGIQQTGLTDVLVVGGVASNLFIRTELQKRLSRKAKLFWAKSNWSTDNAIGVAVLAKEADEAGKMPNS